MLWWNADLRLFTDKCGGNNICLAEKNEEEPKYDERLIWMRMGNKEIVGHYISWNIIYRLKRIEKKINKQIDNMRCRIHHLIRDGSIKFQSGTRILSAHCFDSSNKLIHGQEPQTNLKSDRECVGKSISMGKGWKKFPPVRWQREDEGHSSAFMTNHKWGFSVIELDLD